MDGTPLPVHRKNGWLIVEDSYADIPLKISTNFRQDYADFNVSIQTFVNTYDKNQIDTLYTLIKGLDSVTVLSLKGEQTVVSLSISSDRISLERGIKLGMSKELFYKKFRQLDTVVVKPDKIRVWNFGSSIDFDFNNGTLNKIIWDVGEMD
jgi:hypothetical protein